LISGKKEGAFGKKGAKESVKNAQKYAKTSLLTVTKGAFMIVLLTDFGQSEYVGVMKGVIYSIVPDGRVVDLCHTVSAQNVIEASWLLKSNYKYFPEGTTFCCVVDPGVGTERKAVGLKTESYYFVGPDNGLLWETVKEQRIIDIRQIPIPQDASRTFHGRDVFAKAAASVDLGHFQTIGEKIEEIEKLELYQKDREGIVVRIDRFGNVITNLVRQEEDQYCVEVDGREYVMRYWPNYLSAGEGELFLIEGSSGTLEISLKNGNANDKLCLETGEKIRIWSIQNERE
jgi:S-adenosylmethionine hydrolase